MSCKIDTPVKATYLYNGHEAMDIGGQALKQAYFITPYGQVSVGSIPGTTVGRRQTGRDTDALGQTKHTPSWQRYFKRGSATLQKLSRWSLTNIELASRIWLIGVYRFRITKFNYG